MDDVDYPIHFLCGPDRGKPEGYTSQIDEDILITQWRRIKTMRLSVNEKQERFAATSTITQKPGGSHQATDQFIPGRNAGLPAPMMASVRCSYSLPRFDRYNAETHRGDNDFHEGAQENISSNSWAEKNRA